MPANKSQCKFCGKAVVNVRRHERNCDENPRNRGR